MCREATVLRDRSRIPAAALTALAAVFLLAVTWLGPVSNASHAFRVWLTVPAGMLVLITGLAYGSASQQHTGLLLLWAQFGLLLGLMLLSLLSVGVLLMAPVIFTGIAIAGWPRGADEPVATPLALLLHVLCFASVWGLLFFFIWWR